MLDVVDNDVDQLISDHVVRMHRYRNPNEADGAVLKMGSVYADYLSRTTDTNEKKETTIYEKYNAALHGKSRRDKILSVEFMRKYIHLARCLKPKLTDQACEVIASAYCRLRSQDFEEADVARTQPVTIRTLETLVRLATAHAKARMSKTIDIEDAQAAIELVQFAYFKEVLEKENKKRRRNNENSDEEDDDDDDGDEDQGSQEQQQKSTRTPRQTKRSRIETEKDDTDDEDMQPTPDAGDLTRRDTRRSLRSSDVTRETTTSTEKGTEETPATISEERLHIFKLSLQKLFRESREQSLSLQRITTYVNTNNPEEFSQSEIHAALVRMTDDNQIMLADEIVFLI